MLQHEFSNNQAEDFMPLKVNVGLSKKIGQPNYGSLGASCHVEYEADASLLNTDLEGFQRQVKNAFIACKQAVQDELHRQQAADLASQPTPNDRDCNGSSGGPKGVGPHRTNANENGPTTNGSAANPASSSQRRTSGRRATASQVRALEAIGNRLQLDLDQWLHEKYGIRLPAELSIADASDAIDELNSTTSDDGANH
jgi:hypothetical protein